MRFLASMAGHKSIATTQTNISANDEMKRAAVEHRADDQDEHRQLTKIYFCRGLNSSHAKQVGDQFMTHDTIGAHARDELGISETGKARPVHATFASACSFGVGAAMPFFFAAVIPATSMLITWASRSLEIVGTQRQRYRASWPLLPRDALLANSEQTHLGTLSTVSLVAATADPIKNAARRGISLISSQVSKVAPARPRGARLQIAVG